MSANLTYRYRLGFDTFAEVPSGDFESIQPASHVVFGVPADSSADRRSGTASGPTAIREATAEQISSYKRGGADALVNLHTGEVTMLKVKPRVIDLGDLHNARTPDTSTLAQVRAVASGIRNKSSVPVMLGGDSALLAPFVAGLASQERELVCVLLSNTLVAGLDSSIGGVDPYAALAGSLIMGTCGLQSASLWKTLAAAGTEIVSAETIHEKGIDHIGKSVQRINGLGCDVCLLIDMEVVDSGYASGTPGIDIGGLTPKVFNGIVELLSSIKNVAGVAVVNCAPTLDARGHTEHLAAQALLSIMRGVIFDRSIT